MTAYRFGTDTAYVDLTVRPVDDFDIRVTIRVVVGSFVGEMDVEVDPGDAPRLHARLGYADVGAVREPFEMESFGPPLTLTVTPVNADVASVHAWWHPDPFDEPMDWRFTIPNRLERLY